MLTVLSVTALDLARIQFGATTIFHFLFVPVSIGLAFFILWIYMIVTAYQGKTVVLPVIGPIAQGQA